MKQYLIVVVTLFVISCKQKFPNEFDVKFIGEKFCHPYQVKEYNFKKFDLKILKQFENLKICNESEKFSLIEKNIKNINSFMVKKESFKDCFDNSFHEHYLYYCYHDLFNEKGDKIKYYKKIVLIDTIVKKIYDFEYNAYSR